MINTFTKGQLKQITLGLKNGLTNEQVATYSDPQFRSMQMKEIRLGYENGLCDEQVKAYARHEVLEKVMKEMRLNLERFIFQKQSYEEYRLLLRHDLKKILLDDKIMGLSPEKLKQVRLGLENGLTEEQVMVYAKPIIHTGMMSVIRREFTFGLTIERAKEIVSYNIPMLELLSYEAVCYISDCLIEGINPGRIKDLIERFHYTEPIEDSIYSTDKVEHYVDSENLVIYLAGILEGDDEKDIELRISNSLSSVQMKSTLLDFLNSLPSNIVEKNEIPLGKKKKIKDSEFCCDSVLVEAEGLSIGDEFMKHEPITENEKVTKELILDAIENRVKNFYRPIYDPSFTDDGEGICFLPNRFPAEGKSYEWWSRVAKDYCPSRNSRLGTKLEYGAFIGVLIKKLVEEGKDIKAAWNIVCNDSSEIGNYSANGIEEGIYELTGSRNVCGFFDLANMRKILEYDDEIDNCWIASGSCFNSSTEFPVAYINQIIIPQFTPFSKNNNKTRKHGSASGWIVLS